MSWCHTRASNLLFPFFNNQKKKQNVDDIFVLLYRFGEFTFPRNKRSKLTFRFVVNFISFSHLLQTSNKLFINYNGVPNITFIASYLTANFAYYFITVALRTQRNWGGGVWYVCCAPCIQVASTFCVRSLDVYVVLCGTSAKVCHERRAPSKMPSYHIIYESSKWEFERSVYAERASTA